MNTLELVLAIAALFFGLGSEFVANGRNLAGWGVICLAAIILVARLA